VKTLHGYIVRQVLATLFMTVVVFTFVMLLGNVLKRVLDLLVSQQVSFGLFVEAIGLLLPYVLAFALPMGMLTAALLVFGRFSADHELTAVRASGISLISLVSPVILLSLVMCGISAYVNMELAPKCRMAMKDLVNQARYDFAAAQLPEGRYIKDFDNFIFYVGKNNNGELEDVTVLYLPDNTNVATTVVAPRGKLWREGTNGQVHLKLFNAQSMTILDGDVQNIQIAEGGDVEIEPQGQEKAGKVLKRRVSYMTFSELRAEMRDLAGRFEGVPTPGLSGAGLKQQQARLRRERDKATSPIRVQLHRQLASSFACFGFTLVGIPLGIRVHRRETNIGFGIALGLVMVYYALLLIGGGLETHPEFFPHLIVWIPDFLFQAVGVVLLWRANRGG